MTFPVPAFPLQQQCSSLMSSSYLRIMLACFWILYRESRMNLCVNTLGVIIPNLLCWINKEPFSFAPCVWRDTPLNQLCVSIKLDCPVKKIRWSYRNNEALDVSLSTEVNREIVGVVGCCFFLHTVKSNLFGDKKKSVVAIFTLKSCVFCERWKWDK